MSNLVRLQGWMKPGRIWGPSTFALEAASSSHTAQERGDEVLQGWNKTQTARS